MFKTGNRVRFNFGILKGAKGIIIKDLNNGQYEVRFDHSAALFVVDENEIEHEDLVLPIGNQELLESELETYKPRCDCGGYKVYGSLSQEAHSPWCSIFK